MLLLSFFFFLNVLRSPFILCFTASRVTSSSRFLRWLIGLGAAFCGHEGREVHGLSWQETPGMLN